MLDRASLRGYGAEFLAARGRQSHPYSVVTMSRSGIVLAATRLVATISFLIFVLDIPKVSAQWQTAPTYPADSLFDDRDQKQPTTPNNLPILPYQRNNYFRQGSSGMGNLPGQPGANSGQTLPGMSGVRQNLTEQAYHPLDRKIDPAVYRLGPQDLLELDIWGKTNLELLLQVLPEGTLYLKGIGLFEVAGRTLDEVNRLIQPSLQRQYLGIKFRLNLLRPRVFTLYVTGEVLNPGAYPATAVDRLADLIARAGGISVNGSHTFVEVHEKGEIRNYDLFAFERLGELEQNPYLLEGQVIVVPVLRNRVTVQGPWGRAGRFEFKDGEDARTFLLRIGAPVPESGRKGRLSLRRYDPEKSERLTLQQTFEEIMTGPEVPLVEGDELILEAVDDLSRKVFVSGAHGMVADPSSIDKTGDSLVVLPYLEHMRLLDLLRDVGGVLPSADLQGAAIQRREGDALETIPLRLYDLLVKKDLSADMPLQPEDHLLLPTLETKIRVSGEVKAPRSLPFIKGYSVFSYINDAGGPSVRADLEKLTIVKGDGRTVPWTEDYVLVPGDTIYLPEKMVKFWQDYLYITTSLTSLMFSIMAAFSLGAM